MIIKTRDFGETEINEQDIVTFEEPVFGFEEYHRYVFLFHDEIGDRFAWLQSVEEPGLCFILADPALVDELYTPRISERFKKKLGDGAYMYWVVMVVRDDFKDSTVNLKSPVVVNPETKRAAQMLLEEDLPLRHPLFGRKGER